MAKILKVPDGITWEEFQAKYLRFFPISNLEARVKAMAEEFKRLTGRTPEQKPKRAYNKKKESEAPSTD